MRREDLERTYDKPDPWGYQTNPADIERKQKIIRTISEIAGFGWGVPGMGFDSALDIGCGEGWITKDLPAKKVYGHEMSNQARSRWPSNIKQFVDWPGRNFDLVLATGVLYENYSWQLFIHLMNTQSKKYIVTSNICGREYWPAVEKLEGRLIHLEEFPYYRGPSEMFTQRLRIYKR